MPYTVVTVSALEKRVCAYCKEPIGAGRSIASEGQWYHINLLRDCYNAKLKEHRETGRREGFRSAARNMCELQKRSRG